MFAQDQTHRQTDVLNKMSLALFVGNHWVIEFDNILQDGLYSACFLSIVFELKLLILTYPVYITRDRLVK